MDQVSLDALVVRLVSDPHDGEALALAYEVGTLDPKRYAEFLEAVAGKSAEGAIASHWYAEAASVWSTSLGDAPAAARALMKAVDRDPTQDAASDRLAEMYREKGDVKALCALLERRAKALDPLAAEDSALKPMAAAIHRELGRLWREAPLAQQPKAIENYRRAIEFNDQSLSTISTLRELYRADNRARDALPYYEKEQRLLSDPERKVALYLEEAEVRREMADLPGAAQALREARAIEGGTDASLKQQLGAIILERVQLEQPVSATERAEAVQLFVDLAEEFPGEHGYSYSACALELAPEHERAAQLVMYYGAELGQDEDVAPRVAEYLRVNPEGLMSEEAQAFVTRVLGQAATDASMAEGRASFAARAIGTGHLSEPAPAAKRAETSVVARAPEPDAQEQSVVLRLLGEGQALARKARKHDAAASYQSVLQHDPANAEAIAFLQNYLRQTRKFKELREMLVNASRGARVEAHTRLDWLREVAALSETQLKDLETAVWAWSQVSVLAPEDEQASTQLALLLEKSARWDDLAALLEQRAELVTDLEERLVVEKKAAKIHEEKRGDATAAGSVWARIAILAPDDDAAIQTALRHFAAAKRADLAAQALTEIVGTVENETARAELFGKLGALRDELGDAEAAGDAFTEAGAISADPSHYHAAEACYVRAQAWNQAATSVEARLEKAKAPTEQAALLATVAGYLLKAGDRNESLVRLERAVELDPQAAEPAAELEAGYRADNRLEDIVTVLLQRADAVVDLELKISLRKRAAALQRVELGDVEGSRDTLGLILEDAEDLDVLEQLANDEIEQGNWAEVAQYLHRQVAAQPDITQKTALMLREGAILGNQLADPAGATERYELILSQLDPTNREALQRIADLKAAEQDHVGLAKTLERLLPLIENTEPKLQIANQLADLYEDTLKLPKEAVRILLLIRQLDAEDFSAIQRLVTISEALGDWNALAEYMIELIEVEGDEAEISQMTRRRAEILNEHLARPEEALSALKKVADSGDEACRAEYVALGDKLGREPDVAQALLDWCRGAAPSEARREALRGAFERFLKVEKTEALLGVAEDLVRSGGATLSIASKLEELAAKGQQLGALQLAQQFLVRELSGPLRAEEMVRQAGVLRAARVPVEQCLEHGESGLASMGPKDVGPLLERLSEYTESPEQTVDLYEHQVMRCKDPGDKLRALARAAGIAARHGQLPRAQQFFEIALGSPLEDEGLELLVASATDSDSGAGGHAVVRLLAQVLSASGQSARDGGRMRSRFLARAASLAALVLEDNAQAFTWMGDALIAHVDDERISGVITLARELGDLKQAEAVLERALQEVFDGPHVRLLLASRAKLRRTELHDVAGAGADLKRLHELAPADQEVSDQLILLYHETQDHAGLVHLYEDLVLRTKDKDLRAQLSRKVASLWESKLADPREAADAWRRVLRLIPNDPEATAGLDRAKRNMLHPAAPEEVGEDQFDEAPPLLVSPVEVSPVEVSPVEVSPVEAEVQQADSPEEVEASASAPAEMASEPFATEPALLPFEIEAPHEARAVDVSAPVDPEEGIDGDGLADELSAIFRRIETPASAPNLDSRIEIDLASNAEIGLRGDLSLEASVREAVASQIATDGTLAADVARAPAPSSEEIDVDFDEGAEPAALPSRRLSPPPRPPERRRSNAPPPPPRRPSADPPASRAIVVDGSDEEAMDLNDEELLEGPAT